MNREQENMIPIGFAEDYVHENLIANAFDDAGIDYFIQKIHALSFQQASEPAEGYSRFLVLEKDADEAVKIAKSISNPQNEATE